MLVDPSHFSMVGFAIDVRDATTLTRTADSYLPTCNLAPLKGRDSVCLVHDPSGAELRLGLRGAGSDRAELVTLNPAFVGEGRVDVEIVRDASDPEWKPFEVTMQARFKGEETPLVFDLADPGEALRLKPGAKVSVRLSAFVFKPSVYADEAAYYAAQKTAREGGPSFAADYFIPSGMFAPGDGSALKAAKRPTADALFAGKVLKAERRHNQAGGEDFVWALVETYGGATIDVVIDPRSLPAAPAAGSILDGEFWLSGRIAP